MTMKAAYVAAAALALAGPAAALRMPGAVAGGATAAEAAKRTALHQRFSKWAVAHGRPYATQTGLLGADGEFERRMQVFKANEEHVAYLASIKANSTGWTLSAEGPFMDRTHEEFAAQLTLQAPSENRLPTPFSHAGVEAADDVDWVAKGAVTPIKNQGQCGSCWAFSTVGSMEGANFLATNKLVSLSEQELVSCDNNGDMGCNGGLMDNAFGWIIKNGGLDSEDDYPYEGYASSCKTDKTKKDAAVISGFEDVPADSEADLRKALTMQPVSVAVDASLWQFYGGGVFHGILGYCGTQLNHGVLLVAMDSGKGTYTIKNSWGTTWGDKGFIHLPQDKGAEGMCGVAHCASYPTVKASA